MDPYSLHLRHEDDFEDLVWHVSTRLFGMGTSKFSKGKDAGKDARFRGRAERYPSSTSPWEGTVVIQAKHTGNPIAAFTDNDFQRILKEEAVRIKKLIAAKEMTHYICFTNRKKTGVAGDSIEKKLREEVGLQHLVLEGIDTLVALLEELDLVEKLGLGQPAPGLTLHPEGLERVIRFFDEDIDWEAVVVPNAESEEFYLAKWKEKNQINNLSDSYFQNVVVSDSLCHFAKIEEFLKNPRNSQWKKKYENVAFQFRCKYNTHRGAFGAFEAIFEDIFNRLKLRGNLPEDDKLVYIFLHYMYCTCDIGDRRITL